MFGLSQPSENSDVSREECAWPRRPVVNHQGAEPVKVLKPNTAIMGLFAGAAFGILFGIFMGLTTTPFSNGLNTGLFAGVFFGVAIAVFIRVLNSKHLTVPDEILREEVVAHGPANHFKGAEGRGGWLYITKSNLIFRPHKVNLQKDSLKIPLQDIVRYGERSTLGIIPNGLFVELPSGVNERFVLSQRNEWIDSIHKLIGKGKGTPQFTAPNQIDRLAQIEKLHELNKKGALSDEEFQSEKKKLMG